MNKKVSLLFVGLIIIVFIGILIFNFNKKTDNQKITSQEFTEKTNSTIPTNKLTQQSIDKSLNLISTEEVKNHNKRSDCWLIIDKKVYDVTEFIPQHPGGNILVQGCGTDATTMFEMQRKHSGEEAQSLLPKYYIGDIKS